MVKNLKHFKHLLTRFRILATVIVVLCFLGFLALNAFENKYKDRFYPGVFVGGVPVGGQSYDEAEKLFDTKANILKQNGLKATFTSINGVVKQVSMPMSVVGLTPDNSTEYFALGDWKSDLQEAYAFGHESNIIFNLKDHMRLLFGKKDFYFNNILLKENTDSFLGDQVYNLMKKSAPARFASVNSKITITKEIEGETINREEVLDVLNKKLITLDETTPDFLINKDIPSVTQEKLKPFLGLATSISKDRNVLFQYQGHEWSVLGPKLVTWLTINTENTIDIDQSKLESYLASTVAKFVDNPPEDSRFAMVEGKLVETVPGKAGTIVDEKSVLEKLQKILIESDSSVGVSTINVPIITIEVAPKITKSGIDKYRILDLVGEVRTNFDGSTADREHNIQIGAAAINGMIIAPGAEFSTIAAIGHVGAEEGYVKELVIKENTTTKEYGGGLCQIATTLFRLALNAGLPITERVNHRFVVHYYDPPGLDATIYGPHPDLRFVNDTGNYLLLQARVEGHEVIMELYGQKDGRSVAISKPLMYDKIPAPEVKYTQTPELPLGQTTCSEAEHDGLTTDVTYSVKYVSGSIKKMTFHSVYQPWQKVCLVGTAK
ncbi:MAG: VanW family protein [bacterium]